MNVFDRTMKREQRDLAATRPDSAKFDYLKDEVARRLVDRVLDISKRDFPVAVDLGCGNGHIGRFLGDKGAVQTLIQAELSAKSLKRDLFSSAPGQVVERSGEPIPDYRQTYNVVCDEEFVPLPARSVDLLLSSLALHWVNDLPGCLEQVRKSLKPDGVFLGAMLGGDTLQELRSSLALADMERGGGVRPHLSPFAQIRDCADLLTNAGFGVPTVDTESVRIPYPDMFTLIDHLQGMGEQNAPLLHANTDRDTLMAAASIYEQMYGTPDGNIEATFQIVYMIGWGPAESQPKPSRRGSGRSRLSDLDDLMLDGTVAPPPPPKD